MRIDLHGQMLNEAHSMVAEVIEDCYYRGDKTVQFITGLSGEMHREFPMWVENNERVSGCYEVGRSGGMFNVTLRKKK